MAVDYKKEQKDLYAPKAQPSIIEVPMMRFIAIDGNGDPYSSEEYLEALETLYAFANSIKMSRKFANAPAGYYDFIVPPLEGFYRETDEAYSFNWAVSRGSYLWTVLIRVPEFVTQSFFEYTKMSVSRKTQFIDPNGARLDDIEEGLCAQMMFTGPASQAPEAISALDSFIVESGYKTDISIYRPHHEIYLGDPRKKALEKIKTVIRRPISAV